MTVQSSVFIILQDGYPSLNCITVIDCNNEQWKEFGGHKAKWEEGKEAAFLLGQQQCLNSHCPHQLQEGSNPVEQDTAAERSGGGDKGWRARRDRDTGRWGLGCKDHQGVRAVADCCLVLSPG